LFYQKTKLAKELQKQGLNEKVCCLNWTLKIIEFPYLCSFESKDQIMGRIMAIDYGQKRAGIAVTDESQIIANGLATVHVKDLMVFLKEYIAREKVECIVIGEPRDMKNLPSDASRFIEPFVKNIRKQFPGIVVERMDERFTSQMAFQTMIDAGLGKKSRQNKELIDTISATLILQSYMDHKRHQNNRNQTSQS
jgi:putative holliday junction resolvase